MTLHFSRTLQEALDAIRYGGEYHEFVVHQEEVERGLDNTDDILQRYGDAKWKIVDLLNAKYGRNGGSAVVKFDLYNWLQYNEADEVAYFLSEAGSNVLSHSQFKAPFKFQVWMGTKGFVLGMEQKGKGFNAVHVDEKGIKTNEGAAFEFFRKCRSSVFFNDPHDSTAIFMEHVL